ncbi:MULTISPECIES: hypothetical protein [Clostridium]|jgi:hypothetical protein|uniref:Uncharacterized protein n=1 Tax=Clostridium paridis TaxID=2803863 RepID=A0A937FG90_9CLOT|nr:MULTISPECIES: hypothetical protein [Clostridium]MBL4931712.1 hypothetical protein [Clostridium paridis]MDD7793565.1 hypothetical protein [Clostridium sp. 'White wine YQ']
MAVNKNRKPDKSRSQFERVEYDIPTDEVQTNTSHTANKPQPKFVKK